MADTKAEDGKRDDSFALDVESFPSSRDSLSDTKEQQRGLLGEDEGPARDIEELPDYDSSLQRRRSTQLVLRVAVLLVAVAAVVGLVVSQLIANPVGNTLDSGGKQPSNGTSTTGPLVRPHRGDFSPSKSKAIPDYTIKPDWDYDAGPQKREFFWTITDRELNPDGVYRPMVVINGQFPGPMIEVNEGDTIRVVVKNQAVNATSVHWHGLFQNGTNWMDGTVGITQCPIAPGSQFTYEFAVKQQYGTYWYHSHQGVQAADGLYGPLVIHSREERDLQELEYASDRVVMVSDHYHDTSSALLMDYLKSDAENAEPVPDGALINGRGMRNCDNFEHRKCNTTGLELPRFNLEPNKHHRLRVINTGAFAEFQVSIDEQSFAITEVDGTVVKPSYYERLNINPAQRYSIVVNANGTSPSSTWLRAKMLKYCFTDPPSYIETDTQAVLDFAERPSASSQPTSKDYPTGPSLECRDMNTTDLTPLPAVAAPSRADATYYLRSNFEIGAYRLSRGFFNQSSFRASVESPTLHRAIDGLSTRNRTFFPDALQPSERPGAFLNSAAFHTPRELVIQTSGIQVVDLVISNFDDGNHPLHLHGYKFFVLASGHGYPPANLSDTVDTSNPLRRDTASVEAFGWVMLRFVADNAGAWAFHCHLAWHSEAGLVMQFLTRSEQLKEAEIPEANLRLCEKPRDELRKGMGPEDEVFMVG
jgi:FtsP/CotA-like multicopper oxidase with cupredoxin domain